MNRNDPARDQLGPVATATIAALIATLCAAAGSGEPDGGPPDDLAASWIEHARSCLDGARGLESDFTQEVIHPLDGRGDVSRGRLVVGRGNRIRLEYLEPRRSLLISDGKTVRAWDPQTRTVYESPARGTAIARFAGLALESPDSDDDFDVRWLGGDRVPAPGRRAAIELRPRFPAPLASRIVLAVTGDCPPVRRVVIIDRAGTATRLILSRPELNRGIPASRFAFEPPPGATIIKP